MRLNFFVTAGKPKKNNALKTLAVMLGPDFITDIIEVMQSFSKARFCRYI